MQRTSEDDGVSWLNSDMARFIPVIEVQDSVSCMCLTPTNDLCIGTTKGCILVCVSPHHFIISARIRHLTAFRYYEPFVTKVKPDFKRDVFPSSWMRSDRPVTKIMWLKNPGCLLVVGTSGVELLQIANGWEIDLPFAKALKRLRGITSVACSPGIHAPPCLWLVDRQRRM